MKLKVRAWHIEDKKMEQDRLQYGDAEYYGINGWGYYILTHSTWVIDKQGKDIYFWDIVYIAWFGNTLIDTIADLSVLLFSLPEGDVENIVWNKFENPELLDK